MDEDALDRRGGEDVQIQLLTLRTAKDGELTARPHCLITGLHIRNDGFISKHVHNYALTDKPFGVKGWMSVNTQAHTHAFLCRLLTERELHNNTHDRPCHPFLCADRSKGIYEHLTHTFAHMHFSVLTEMALANTTRTQTQALQEITIPHSCVRLTG